MAKDLGLKIDSEFTCETAQIFYTQQVESRWNEFLTNLKKGRFNKDLDNVAQYFPFTRYIQRRGVETEQWTLFPNKSIFGIETTAKYYYESLENTFQVIREVRFLELLRNHKERARYLVNEYVRVVAMTSTHSI